MTRVDTVGWIDRQRPAVRIALLLVASVFALFVAGVLVGFIAASLEHGHLLPRKPLGWGVLIAALAACYGLYRAIRRLMRPSLATGLTSFEQRYSKMWLIVMALSTPIGIGLAMLVLRRGDGLNLGSLVQGPLPASGAILLAAALTITLALSVIVYHRAIDDHEERAYLWGSQVAYYFLAAALPIYWLLFRGGLVPALTAGGAMILLLVSFLVQAAVWAWFKFR